MKDIDQLIPDIYDLLKGKLISDPAVLDRFGPELGKVFTTKILSKNEEQVPTLRMSNIGRPLRQLYYELHGYKGEELQGNTLLKFLYGDLLEGLVLVLAEAAGHTVENLQKEIEVDGIKGHIDATIDGVLVDVKSCSPYSFSKFETGRLLEDGQDPFGYQGQLAGYAKALGIDARWVAIQKVSGELCTLVLPESRISSYDISARIDLVRRRTETAGDIPERCYSDEPHQKSGNRALGISCSYCSYKRTCWNDSNDGEGLRTFLYNGSPVFFTKINRMPKTFEIRNNNNE